MTDPKPMDPERLAALKGYLTGDRSAPEPEWDGRDGFECEVAALILDRDHRVRDVERLGLLLRDAKRASSHNLSEVESLREQRRDLSADKVRLITNAKRWRDQCLVAAEHVKTAGATPMQALVWARAHGWEGSEVEPWPDHGWGLMRLRAPGSLSECDAVIYETDAHGPVELGIAGLCNESARELATPCSHDILDEMAAIEVPT